MAQLKLSIFVLFTLWFVQTSYGQHSEDLKLNTISLALTGKLPNDGERKYLESLPGEGSKLIFIDSLLRKKDFYKFIESKFLEEYLEGVTEEYLYEQIQDYIFLSLSRKNSVNQSKFQRAFESLNYLGKIKKGRFNVDKLSIADIRQNIFFSPIYESINMGSFNYAASVFQHLLNRKPTHIELTESIKMIDGKYGNLFNTAGSSKADFIHILFNNPEFKENQIRYWYAYFFNEVIDVADLLELIMQDFNSTEELLRYLALKLWNDDNEFTDLSSDLKLKSPHAFFSIAYYQLFGQNISNKLLQKYIIAFKNSGDKNLIKDVVLQSLINKSSSYEDEELFYDINSLDLAEFDLPQTSSYSPDNLTNLFKFFIFNEYNYFCETANYFPIEEVVAKTYKVIPNIASSLFSEENENYNCSQTYLLLYESVQNNLSELNTLKNYYEGSYNNYNSNCKTINKKEFYTLTEEKALRSFPSILYTFQCLNLKENIEEEVQAKEKPSFLQTNDINTIFKVLLSRNPTSQEKEFYEDILAKQTDESLRIVYQLIMTSEEYNYY